MSRAWAALLAFTVALSASAQSDYEDRLIAWGLAKTGRELEPSPEGKRIDEVLVASEDIVARTDPYPRLLNWVHITTKPSVITREVLLKPGDVYRQELADESERILRKLFILAVARIVPVRGQTPGSVSLLVVTKDLWSIRLNSEFNLVGSLLQYLRLRPSEQNFLGLDKQLSLDFLLKLDVMGLGQQYHDPRFLGTPAGLMERALVYFNRATGRPEGSSGELAIERDFDTLATQTAFRVGGTWDVYRQREFVGADIQQLPYVDPAGQSSLVPFVYDARELSFGATYGRSFGSHFKTDLIGGVTAHSLRYTAPTDEGLTEDQRGWLQRTALPNSEDAVFLSGVVELYEASYARLRNINTFAISEDFRLGHTLLFEANWSDPVFFSPLRYVELGAAARYRWLLGGDLLTVWAAGKTRWMPSAPDLGASSEWVNRRYAFQVTNVSPVLGPGRVVARALLDLTYEDLTHRVVKLGGGNGLRGLAPDSLNGAPHMLLWNLEYRTLPWEFHTLHAGLVLFWDAGAVYQGAPQLTHTVGIGLRALFPQFDVEPVRIDFGYVINGPNPPALQRLSASFGQVTELYPNFLSQPL